jgi:glycosyltransferase involved in cell wall biosynthesis
MALRDPLTNSLQIAYMRIFSSQVFADATLVLCLTKNDAEMVCRLGCSPAKIRIVPNAVDTDVFKPSEQEEVDTILWVGRMVPEKGIGHLLSVMRKTLVDPNKVRFVLIGDGPLRAKISRFVRARNWQDRVVMLGYQDAASVAEWFGKASVFLFTSVREGLPRVVLEAMAAARPIASFDLPSLREVICPNKEGILVPYGNEDALAEAVLTLNRDAALRRKLGGFARERVSKSFNWELVLSMLSRVYDEAISKR